MVLSWIIGSTKPVWMYVFALIPLVSLRFVQSDTSAVPRRQFCGRIFCRDQIQFCSSPCHFQCLRLILVLLACFRIGEATNPGPLNPEDLTDCFVLGCFNPSGLGNKAAQIRHDLEYGDIWSVSETHLSSRALQAFRSSLRFSGSRHKCIAGHPTPARAHSVSAGSWKGVATIARHPTRRVICHWSDEIERSARAVVTVTHLRDMWVTVGTMYGEPEGGAHPNHFVHNNALLTAVASQVCFLSRGLRMVAGDLNVNENDLPAFSILHDHGFKDIQQIAWERWGIPIAMTCKGRTRRDYCFLSPELQELLVQVDVTHDQWPDHSLLQGVFRHVNKLHPRQVWNPPNTFPWPVSFEVASNIWSTSDGTLAQRYESLWHELETVAAKSSPVQVPRCSRGRGATEFTRVQKHTEVGPMKPSRKGDLQPLFSGLSFRYTQWFRQARRLQAYVRHVQNRPKAVKSDHTQQPYGILLCKLVVSRMVSADGGAPSHTESLVPQKHAQPFLRDMYRPLASTSPWS